MNSLKINPMRTVKNILDVKGPHFNYISADSTVLESLALMQCNNLSYVIVMENGRYAGILSERDYARKVILQNRNSSTTKVKEIMANDLPVLDASTTVEKAMILMNGCKSRYLPVFEDFDFIGVITIHDLMREAMRDNDLKNVADGVITQTDTAGEYMHYWI